MYVVKWRAQCHCGSPQKRRSQKDKQDSFKPRSHAAGRHFGQWENVASWFAAAEAGPLERMLNLEFRVGELATLGKAHVRTAIGRCVHASKTTTSIFKSSPSHGFRHCLLRLEMPEL